MPNVGEDSEQWAAERLAQRVGLLAAGLADRPHLDGERFTVADACAFWALRMYHRLLHVDLPAPFDRYLDRVGARLAVHEALTAEGMSF